MSVQALNVAMLPWLQIPYAYLAAQYIGERPPSGLIISGKRGLGKHLLVQELIRLILCLNPHEQTPCGGCQSCLWAEHYHPDRLYIDSERENKAIRVEQIRGINHFVHLTSETGKKVICIFHAELMNINAANSLLKNLEEPPKNTYFILVTEAPHKLAVTIKSRCQHYALMTPPKMVAQTWLSSYIPQNHDQELLLAIAFGAPIQALKYYENESLTTVLQIEEVFLSVLMQQNTIAKLTQLLHTHLSMALDLIYLWLMEALHVKSCDQPAFFTDTPQIVLNLIAKSNQQLMESCQAVLVIINGQSTQIRSDWQLESCLAKLLF